MCCHFKGDHGGDQDLSFMEAARFEIRRKKGASHVDIWGKGVSGRENKCESLEMRVCLDSSRNSKKLGYLEGSEKEDKT